MNDPFGLPTKMGDFRCGRCGHLLDGDTDEPVKARELRKAVTGHDEHDPRYTWLPGVIERLREHAPADEDPSAMFEAADVLGVMYDDIRAALGVSTNESEHSS